MNQDQLPCKKVTQLFLIHTYVDILILYIISIMRYKIVLRPAENNF